MRLLRVLTFATLLVGSILGLSGCSLFMNFFSRPEGKTESKPKQSNYERLAAKAEAGDAEAARDLAKWCYAHDADNSRVKYWLGVAARNGDKGSAKVADHLSEWQ